MLGKNPTTELPPAKLSLHTCCMQGSRGKTISCCEHMGTTSTAAASIVRLVSPQAHMPTSSPQAGSGPWVGLASSLPPPSLGRGLSAELQGRCQRQCTEQVLIWQCGVTPCRVYRLWCNADEITVKSNLCVFSKRGLDTGDTQNT